MSRYKYCPSDCIESKGGKNCQDCTDNPDYSDIPTQDLIAELERRRPKCSAETCEHIGSELCGSCIWGVFIGEESGSIKDNFKEVI